MTFSLFSSLLAFFLAAAYYLTRLGFSNEIWPVVSTLGVSLLLINAGRKSFYSSLVFFAGAILISQITDFISSQIPLIIVVIFGYGSFLINNLSRPRLIFLIPVLAFSLWVVGTVWGSSYHNPLLVENMILNHGNEDTLFNPALSQMIKTYNTISTGLDGTPFMSYHWGSHWLMAQFSKLVNVNLITFYQLAYPVIFIPLFFHYFFLFISEIRRVFNLPQNTDLKFYFALTILFVGFIPNAILKNAGFPLFDLFSSESYLMSSLFFFIALTFLIKTRANFSFVHFIFFAGLIMFVGLTKISTLFLLLVPVGYFFWRFKLCQQWKYIPYIIFLFLVVVFTSRLTYNRTYNSTYFSLFNYWQLFVAYPWRPFFLLFVLLWPALFIFAIFSARRISTVADLKIAFVKKQILDVEAVAIFTFFGLLPAAFIFLDGAAALYFFDLSRWFAAAFILANLPLFFPQKKFLPADFAKIKLSSIYIFILSASFVTSCIFNIGEALSNFKIQQTTLRFNLINLADKNYYQKYITTNNLAGNFLEKKLRTAKTILNTPDKIIQNNRKYQMLRLLEAMGKTPPAEKKKSLLYIPYNNTSYWQMLSCLQTPLIAPSLSGIAMLNGYPPNKCRVWGFGYEYYEKEASSVENEFPNRQTMCNKTKKLGFSKIIILTTARKADMQTINCQ